MRVTGKDEFEIAPGQAEAVRDWVLQMERAYQRDGFSVAEHFGRASDHGFDFDDSVLGFLNPRNAQIHLFYAEEKNLAVKAEELAHYFQYKEQGLLGQTEEEIGLRRIDANETEIMTVLLQHGFRRKR